ncbi:hypothetical protein KAR91_24455 [Candidatus Pacearchaeota archaeon]|nr:hypothetical protein [Candidatus Pacearchaeota archaeon]
MKEDAQNEEKPLTAVDLQRRVMPDIVKRPIYGFGNGCRKCIFSDSGSSHCSRPDELDCYDDETEQDYYFAKKA